MRSHNAQYDPIWYPFSPSRDVEEYGTIPVDRGDGVYVVDASGKRYIDAIGSWWVSILGHNHPEITAAIKNQLDRIEQVIMAGFIAQPSRMLAQKLFAVLPEGLTRIFYSDDGSTSVEAALKMALQYWAQRGEERTEFIALDGAYHGDTLGAMSVGSIPHYHTLFHERFKQFRYAHSPYCYRCPVQKAPQSCAAECMDSLEALLHEQSERTAAVIFEPMVQGAAGMRVYPDKVLRRIFDLCERSGVLSIADEVAMGMGRTGKLFACEHAKRVPDIMCLAKGLTGGYIPLAATVVQEHVYEQFVGDFCAGRIFHHGHSFTGNPLAAAAGCATLDILTRENIPASLDGKMERFRHELQRFGDIEKVGDIRGIGMVGALELVKDPATKAAFSPESRIAFRICRNALENGVLIRPLGDVIYFIPAYIITDEQMDTMFTVAYEAINKVLSP